MYENIFIYNFIPNFLFSLFFLIINIVFSIKISKNVNVRKLFFFEDFQPIIIFYLIFCIYVFVLNLTVIVNYKFIKNSNIE